MVTGITSNSSGRRSPCRMPRMDTIFWKKVSNTVSERMIDNSLTHRFVIPDAKNSKKISVKTKIFNRLLKQQCSNYQNYVRLKKKMIEILAEEKDIEGLDDINHIFDKLVVLDDECASDISDNNPELNNLSDNDNGLESVGIEEKINPSSEHSVELNKEEISNPLSFEQDTSDHQNENTNFDDSISIFDEKLSIAGSKFGLEADVDDQSHVQEKIEDSIEKTSIDLHDKEEDKEKIEEADNVGDNDKVDESLIDLDNGEQSVRLESKIEEDLVENNEDSSANKNEVNENTGELIEENSSDSGGDKLVIISGSDDIDQDGKDLIIEDHSSESDDEKLAISKSASEIEEDGKELVLTQVEGKINENHYLIEENSSESGNEKLVLSRSESEAENDDSKCLSLRITDDSFSEEVSNKLDTDDQEKSRLELKVGDDIDVQNDENRPSVCGTNEINENNGNFVEESSSELIVDEKISMKLKPEEEKVEANDNLKDLLDEDDDLFDNISLDLDNEKDSHLEPIVKNIEVQTNENLPSINENAIVTQSNDDFVDKISGNLSNDQHESPKSDEKEEDNPGKYLASPIVNNNVDDAVFDDDDDDFFLETLKYLEEEEKSAKLEPEVDDIVVQVNEYQSPVDQDDEIDENNSTSQHSSPVIDDIDKTNDDFNKETFTELETEFHSPRSKSEEEEDDDGPTEEIQVTIKDCENSSPITNQVNDENLIELNNKIQSPTSKSEEEDDQLSGKNSPDLNNEIQLDSSQRSPSPISDNIDQDDSSQCSQERNKSQVKITSNQVVVSKYTIIKDKPKSDMSKSERLLKKNKFSRAASPRPSTSNQNEKTVDVQNDEEKEEEEEVEEYRKERKLRIKNKSYRESQINPTFKDSLRYVLKHLPERDYYSGPNKDDHITFDNNNVGPPDEEDSDSEYEEDDSNDETSWIRYKDIDSYVKSKNLKPLAMESSYTFDDLGEDDEILMMEIPKYIIDEGNLEGQSMKLRKRYIEIGGTRYNISRVEDDEFTLVLKNNHQDDSYRIENINPIKSIIIQKPQLPVQQDNDNENLSDDSEEEISFPKNIRTRNPLELENQIIRSDHKRKHKLPEDSVEPKKMKIN